MDRVQPRARCAAGMLPIGSLRGWAAAHAAAPPRPYRRQATWLRIFRDPLKIGPLTVRFFGQRGAPSRIPACRPRCGPLALFSLLGRSRSGASSYRGPRGRETAQHPSTPRAMPHRHDGSCSRKFFIRLTAKRLNLFMPLDARVSCPPRAHPAPTPRSPRPSPSRSASPCSCRGEGAHSAAQRHSDPPPSGLLPL